MSRVKKYIEKRAEDNSNFNKHINIERERLELAVKLTELRKAAGLSQKELAEKIGKPQSTISRIETGEMNPSIELIIEISHGLDKEFKPVFQ